MSSYDEIPPHSHVFAAVMPALCVECVYLSDTHIQVLGILGSCLSIYLWKPRTIMLSSSRSLPRLFLLRVLLQWFFIFVTTADLIVKSYLYHM